MKPSLPADVLKRAESRLAAANAAIAALYPGESERRQPVHTVYGGAHLFRSDTAPRLGKTALAVLEEYAGDAGAFARACGLSGDQAHAVSVYDRVTRKLLVEPVEDFRIDFEDGYGNRSDAEEDGHARSAALEVAAGMKANTLPPFLGIRIKPLTEELKSRSLRTLDLFLTTLVREGGGIPDGFVITLSKVTTPEQSAVLADILGSLETALELAPGRLEFELMIETTQSILDEHGASGLQKQVRAGGGRVIAAHFGTYDYTASCQITAAHQHMAHHACDFARHMMQVALAGTGVWLSDGATNILPVAPHRAADGGSLSASDAAENRRVVHAAWALHYAHVRHSLEHAFYQGWDLHPAQLPTRYAAVYSFFMEGLAPAAERLSNFVGKAAQATLVGEVFDDAATGQGLLNYFLRAVNCGAISEDEAADMSGVTLEELRGRSFVKILNNRRG